MLDRGIGILGIALAIISGIWSLAPEGWPKVPPGLLFAGLGIGLLLVGLAMGLMIGDLRKGRGANLADAAVRREDFPTTNWDKQLKNVFRVHFKNETVLLDGCDFIECTFDNVTFKYDGTKPYRLTNAKGNSRKLTTDNKVVGQTVLLLRDLKVVTDMGNFEIYPRNSR
jgi:hypothetical protein